MPIKLLVPAKTKYKPATFLEFLYGLRRLDETKFKAEIKKMIKSQPSFKTFFRLQRKDMDRFLRDENKSDIFEFLLKHEAQANRFFVPPSKHKSGVYPIGDSLIMQWGNVQHSYSTNSSDTSASKGCRLILGTVKDAVYTTITTPDAKYVEGYGCGQDENGNWNRAKYFNVDCTKTVNFNFSANLKYSAPGVVTAVYLVPMNKYIKDKGLSVQNADYYSYGTDDASTAYSHIVDKYIGNLNDIIDEYGFGYGDAQGVGQCSTVEIDICEMTPNSLAVTLHGIKSEGEYDKTGTQVNVHNFRGDTPSANCELYQKTAADADFVLITSEGPVWGTYGPSEKFTINTTLPFEIDATIQYNTPTVEDVRLTVVLTQGNAQLKLVVHSEDGAFPEWEYLEEMNVVVSNWVDTYDATATSFFDTSTWWLDGFKNNGSTTDYRAWTKQSQYQTTDSSSSQNDIAASLETMLDEQGVSVNYRSYDYAYTMSRDQENHASAMWNNKVSFSGIFNFQILVGDPQPQSTTTTLPVWIMDAMYRGFVQKPYANPDKSIEYRGEYESVYGVIYDNEATDCAMKTVNSDISTLNNDYVGAGHNFFNYQTHNAPYSNDIYKSTKLYSLGSYFRPVSTASTTLLYMSKKEKQVMTDRAEKLNYGSDSYVYSVLTIDPYTAGVWGLNFLDATGLMINGAVFSPPSV
jgi:hypothetical protein